MTKKIAIFIDEGNVWSSYKSMGKLLDYNKFKKYFEKKFSGKLYRIFFYTAYPKDNTRKYNLDKRHKFFTYLKKELGFAIRKKPLKTIILKDGEGSVIHDQKTGKPASIEKGNLDVELTIDAMRFSNEYQIAIFFSGDSDFLPLISFLRNSKKKKVYVFSTKSSISKELKSGSDAYFDLLKAKELHGEKLQYRHKRNSPPTQ